MRSKFLLAFALVLAAGSAAFAAATGDQIRTAISDSTVQGNMAASGPYAEYYAPDAEVARHMWTVRFRALRRALGTERNNHDR